ncbi:MAG: hypothetical protein OS130_01880 [Thermodesulfobacteriota bacterium]|nr:MAG: hypothetical protein OS130_01880 [Thermodesulfobacteriota bacterium]
MASLNIRLSVAEKEKLMRMVQEGNTILSNLIRKSLSLTPPTVLEKRKPFI